MKTEKQQAPLRAIARIRKVFGIRGEVKIESYARSADEFEELRYILLGENEGAVVRAEIESVKMRGEEIYLKFSTIDNRTAAEKISGQFLFVEETRRKQLPKEKFFIDDLIGCVVLSESGKIFGKVISVDAYPAQMVYTVNTQKGNVLFPAVREFIERVDVEKKEIVIRPPEGLFDGEML